VDEYYVDLINQYRKLYAVIGKDGGIVLRTFDRDQANGIAFLLNNKSDIFGYLSYCFEHRICDPEFGDLIEAYLQDDAVLDVKPELASLRAALNKYTERLVNAKPVNPKAFVKHAKNIMSLTQQLEVKTVIKRHIYFLKQWLKPEKEKFLVMLQSVQEEENEKRS